MKGLKTVYICSECGCVSPKWLGKCNQCGAWNSLVEDVISTAPEKPSEVKHKTLTSGRDNVALRFDETELPDYIRSNTRLNELDRVLAAFTRLMVQPPKPPPIMREPVTPHSLAMVANRSSSSQLTS